MPDEKNTESEPLESELFKNAMQSVSPLRKKHNHALHEKPKPPAKKIEQPDFDDDGIISRFSDLEHKDILLAGDILSHCSEGIQKTVFRKLRGGRYPIAAELDLHGLTSKEARNLLYEFLTIIDIPSNHCVRIIHGKGHRSENQKAILKTKTYHWLKHHERVLAFYSTLPADGGTGAVYVLLKTLF
jgi:DNA-nicking Smr family endonuclease